MAIEMSAEAADPRKPLLDRRTLVGLRDEHDRDPDRQPPGLAGCERDPDARGHGGAELEAEANRRRRACEPSDCAAQGKVGARRQRVSDSTRRRLRESF
jgi:hypothetical protein